MRRSTLPLLLTLSVPTLACSSKPEETAPPRAKAEQRAIDSTIGASSLPGARGVQGAIAVSDSAAAKRALEDSIARNP